MINTSHIPLTCHQIQKHEAPGFPDTCDQQYGQTAYQFKCPIFTIHRFSKQNAYSIIHGSNRQPGAARGNGKPTRVPAQRNLTNRTSKSGAADAPGATWHRTYWPIHERRDTAPPRNTGGDGRIGYLRACDPARCRTWRGPRDRRGWGTWGPGWGPTWGPRRARARWWWRCARKRPPSSSGTPPPFTSAAGSSPLLLDDESHHHQKLLLRSTRELTPPPASRAIPQLPSLFRSVGAGVRVSTTQWGVASGGHATGRVATHELLTCGLGRRPVGPLDPD